MWWSIIRQIIFMFYHRSSFTQFLHWWFDWSDLWGSGVNLIIDSSICHKTYKFEQMCGDAFGNSESATHFWQKHFFFFLCKIILSLYNQNIYLDYHKGELLTRNNHLWYFKSYEYDLTIVSCLRASVGTEKVTIYVLGPWKWIH